MNCVNEDENDDQQINQCNKVIGHLAEAEGIYSCYCNQQMKKHITDMVSSIYDFSHEQLTYKLCISFMIQESFHFCRLH